MTIMEYYKEDENFGTKIIINDEETKKEIDLIPINKLKNKLEERVLNRKTYKDRKNIQAVLEIQEEYEKLNNDQKDYFVSYLLSKISGLSDLYLSVLEDPESYIKIKKFLDKTKEQSNRTIFPKE